MTSSELRGPESLDFDLLLCLRHDWPVFPCKVIELHEVWRHPLDRQADEQAAPADPERVASPRS